MDESSSMDGSLTSSHHVEEEEVHESEDYEDVEIVLSEKRQIFSETRRQRTIVDSINDLAHDKGFNLPALDFQLLLSECSQSEALEAWMESIHSMMEETFARLDIQRNAVASTRHEAKLRDADQESLASKVETQQATIKALKQKEHELTLKLKLYEESTTSSTKDGRKAEGDNKKKIKSLETIIQEHERRYRVKEQEFEKLKKKLIALAEKDSETSQRNKDILHILNTRDISMIDESFSELGINTSSQSGKSIGNVNNQSLLSAATHNSKSNRLSPTSAGPARSRGGNNNNSSSNTSSAHARLTKDERIENLTYALKALESDRQALQARNLELEMQVTDLVTELNDEKTQQRNKEQSAKMGGSRSDAMKKRSGRVQRNNVDDAEATEDDEDDALPLAKRHEYQAIINAQSHKLDELAHKLEVTRIQQQEAVQKIETLRQHTKESHTEIENLRLELEARPSIRQWNAAQREIHEMETKIHELVLLRGEAAEVAAWRKHLSTAERIKIDKRNHELGLWLLESLPKTVMKESLQMVCRELDCKDLSEIQTALQKLKAVVRTVPRMERFIGKVTAFVFDRTVLLNDRLQQPTPETLAHETLEKTLALLQRWWQLVQKSLDLDTFRESVLFEMFRATELLLKQPESTDRDRNPAVDLTLHPTNSDGKVPELSQKRLVQYWTDYARQDWLLRDPMLVLNKIRDMADLQAEVLTSRRAVTATETFVRERPDLLVNRIVAHLQYLLEVKHLDGLLPQVNKLYVFAEEMRNFLTGLRGLLDLERTASSGTLVEETLSVLTRLRNMRQQHHQQPHQHHSST